MALPTSYVQLHVLSGKRQKKLWELKSLLLDFLSVPCSWNLERNDTKLDVHEGLKLDRLPVQISPSRNCPRILLTGGPGLGKCHTHFQSAVGLLTFFFREKPCPILSLTNPNLPLGVQGQFHSQAVFPWLLCLVLPTHCSNDAWKTWKKAALFTYS